MSAAATLEDTLSETLSDTLSWPFFEAHHRGFAEELARWADATLPALPHDDVDAACRARVAALGSAGFLKAAIPAAYGGLHDALDVRTLCVAREILAFCYGLADFAFARANWSSVIASMSARS